MRIISGEYGGRKINPPSKMPYTRPTTDIAKEGLFNVLQHNLDIEELKTLGSFWWHRAASVMNWHQEEHSELVIVEKDNTMYEFIKKTIQ